MQVKTNQIIRHTMQCALDLTANARNGIEKYFKSEQALFSSEASFHIYIEKKPENRQGNLAFSLFFHNETNENLSVLIDNRVAVMECVLKNDGFLATGFHVRGKREPVVTNRRYETQLKFILNRHTAAPMPIELYTALRELPIAEERSEYVKKRISSWEGYLRIQEMNADVEDIQTTFARPSLSEDFSKLQLICKDLSGKVLRSLQGFSANITGLSGDIGNVSQVKPAQKLVEIDLSPHYKNRARRHDFNLFEFRQITFSNFAELSQVRRLRKGFKDLQDGLAANPNLEKVLFEERPVVRISKEQKELEFHNRLNEFQREAVTGAMTAHDLYVIQGPPGTGKTTVISEICYQNAKAGLRTLVASQANLAVDNALGRLLDDQDIRILRYGRTESIEEEGKKFIEENVATYWKEQTIQSLENELRLHEEKAAELEKSAKSTEETMTELTHLLQEIELKIKEKEQAVKSHEQLLAESHVLTGERKSLITQIDKLQKNLQTFEANEQQAKEKIEALEKQVKIYKIEQAEQLNYDQDLLDLKRIETSIQYGTLLETEKELVEKMDKIQNQQRENQMTIERLETFLEESLGILKLEDFQKSTKTYQIELPQTAISKINELDMLIFKIKESLSNSSYDDWKKLEQRIDKAIHLLENTLQQQGFLTQATQAALYGKQFSPKEVHAFLDRMARALIEPKTKELLSTRNYSVEKYELLERFASAYTFLKVQKGYVKLQYGQFDLQQSMIEQSKNLFKEIKKETIEMVNRQLNESHQQFEENTENLTLLPEEQSAVKEKLAQFEQVHVSSMTNLTELKETLLQVKARIEAFEHKRKHYEQYETELDSKKETVQKLIETIEKEKEQQLKHQKGLEQVDGNLSGKEEKCKVLEEIIASTPEKEQDDITRKIDFYQTELKDIQKQQARLPLKKQLQKNWLEMLNNATEYDLDEIKKLYIEHANVIGTTCVASARRDFMEDYPTFDVVIIDEVSKATPPELLLPMLKGKKIILVGDHHQLPPLMGQETLEEFLEESSNREEKRELAQLLKESLFERLFRTLPKQNKTMLAIQYRMHEKIMKTITPFYQEGNYALQCGLENSDHDRDHLLESRSIERGKHLYWFDLPNEKPFFEAQVKGGTSRFNEAELTKIRHLLIELNEATKKAIEAGRLEAGTKKSVGVISFYGEQVKRIDRLIEHELHLPYLHCRTGSVDKFQGMEMDVILLSFVRNHDHPNGDIGFAKDYRRLNVALSRARELLMIIGSSEMFTKRPKNIQTREMFERLLNDVREQGGLISQSVEGVH